MQQKSSSGKSTIKSSHLLTAVITVLLCLFSLYYIDSWLRVTHIQIIGVGSEVPIYGLESIKKSRMFFLSENKTSDYIKRINPLFETVTITKLYPQTIKLHIVLDKPVAYLKADQGFFVMSKQAKILEKVKTKNIHSLPVITYFQKFGYDSYQRGDNLNRSDLLKALYISERCRQLGIRANTIDIDGVDVIGLYVDKKAIIFSSEKDQDSQLYQLEQILHQFRIQGDDFSKLDLRYNRPILELIQ